MFKSLCVKCSVINESKRKAAAHPLSSRHQVRYNYMQLMASGSSAFSNCLCGGSRSLCLSCLLLVSYECQSMPLCRRFWPEEANWVISRAAILGGGNHYCNEVTTKIKIGIKWSMSESPASVLSDNQELGPYSVRVPVRFANKVLLSSGFLPLLLSDSCRNSPHSAVCPLFCFRRASSSRTPVTSCQLPLSISI